VLLLNQSFTKFASEKEINQMNMKTGISLIVLFVIGISVLAFNKSTNQAAKEPWTNSQLLNPADLAATLNNPKAPKPYLFCIGPQTVIKGSIDIGPTVEKENLEKLSEQLKKLPENADIVIYCGCCPFSRCPNIRPAFELLNSMHFKNQKLLNLSHNVKVDWIDHGYPVVE
jgi:thiosulfate/3-mercaptopyruvate sulfurtransferase